MSKSWNRPATEDSREATCSDPVDEGLLALNCFVKGNSCAPWTMWLNWGVLSDRLFIEWIGIFGNGSLIFEKSFKKVQIWLFFHFDLLFHLWNLILQHFMLWKGIFSSSFLEPPGASQAIPLALFPLPRMLFLLIWTWIALLTCLCSNVTLLEGPLLTDCRHKAPPHSVLSALFFVSAALSTVVCSVVCYYVSSLSLW